jgi:hypothetical protein
MDFPFQEVEKLTFRMNSIQKKSGRLQAAPVKGRLSRSRPGTSRGQGAAGAGATLTSLGYFPPLSKAINARKRTGSARQQAMVA